MPLNPLVSSLIGSILSAVLEAPQAPVEQPGTPVVAVRRIFPATSIPGVLATAPYRGQVIIDNHLLLAAPGLQIRNGSNRIVLSSKLKGSNYPVLFQMDATGKRVSRIWILTQNEIAALKAAGKIKSDIPDQATPTTPTPLPMPISGLSSLREPE